MDTSFHGYQSNSKVVGPASECVVIINQLERSYYRVEGKLYIPSVACLYVYMCMRAYACVCVRVCICICVFVYLCVCACLCICVCISVCLYVSGRMWARMH